MEYELMKELMKAGFPAKLVDKNQSQHWFGVSSNETYAYPTLEELIEACGDLTLLIGKDKTVALNAVNPMDSTCRSEGATVIEAVAMLWLALNPTSTNKEVE